MVLNQSHTHFEHLTCCPVTFSSCWTQHCYNLHVTRI